MENHIIIKEDGSRLLWTNNRFNKKFCLLYNDNNQKYSFTPQANLKCKLFMIAGGGAGGYYFGGGGGAGAAYINNNFIFEQGKTYTFSIGTGGSCDIKDFDKLFNSGLSLNIYNNTSPKLNNISFNYDDYSSLGITSSDIMQSLIVNNITINPNIFNTNTTYIWSGYIKSTSDKIASIRFNSKIKTVLWFNTYNYTTENALISTTGETNIQEVKVLQLDPNKFYNIKIIAYNYDASNNANFNVDFVNCQLYNYNKKFENYNVIPATDTTLTFKTISDNDNNVISCKGGGTGGYGLYNQNKNLNGGCGGGSGINKIKGVSTNNNPIYNGSDGAIGNYCGGGGGIISSGNDNKGGEGKILNWFDESLLFGAGGNGANYKNERKLGYGCGGNGGDCCYFSKSIINNNGNNGCILIYIDDTNDITEHFTDVSIKKNINYLTINSNAIAAKLINESFQIANYQNYKIPIDSVASRKNYFDKNLSFNSLSVDKPTAGSATTDNNDMHNFIYDVLVISRIYAVAYRLLYHHYKTTLSSDITAFKTFMNAAKISFSSGSSSAITSATNVINFNNIFDITTLNLSADKTQADYSNTTTGMYTNSSGVNMTAAVFNVSSNDICGENGYHIPAYHNVNDGTKFKGFDLFMTTNTSGATANINKIANANSSSTETNTYDISNSSTTTVSVQFTNTSSYLTRDTIKNLYNNYNTNITTDATYKDKYNYTRILLYLEAFNTILNTDSYTSLLPMLKYQMFNYNAIIYNVILQYEIFNFQSKRVKINGSTAFEAEASGMTTLLSNITSDLSTLKTNLDLIIINNINTPGATKDTVNTIVDIIDKNNSGDIHFKKNQLELNETINKYNSEFDYNNNLIYYYKIIIIIALFLILVIFFIFSLNSLDNNTKIAVYVLLILFIIILLAYYNNSFSIKENFIVANNKNEQAALYTALNEFINYNQYINSLGDYNSKITKIIISATMTKDILTPIKVFSDKAYISRINKAEYYKLKKINLNNGIEILKKSSNTYYYLIILIILSTIILLFSVILLLLNPEMLIAVIALAAIFMIFLIYYISYNINKTTRLAENKNYWANFNPSKETLGNL